MSAAACAAKKLLCGVIARNLRDENVDLIDETQNSDLSVEVKTAILEAVINNEKDLFLQIELLKAGEVVE